MVDRIPFSHFTFKLVLGVMQRSGMNLGHILGTVGLQTLRGILTCLGQSSVSFTALSIRQEKGPNCFHPCSGSSLGMPQANLFTYDTPKRNLLTPTRQSHCLNHGRILKATRFTFNILSGWGLPRRTFKVESWTAIPGLEPLPACLRVFLCPNILVLHYLGVR